MSELIEKIKSEIRSQADLGYFIDMAGEFYIYKGDSEDPEEFVFEGTIFSFIERLMEELGVRSDGL